MIPTQEQLDALPASRKKKPVNFETDSVEQPASTPVSDPLANILDLPSNGKFGYPASVKFRDIMAGDEEILATTTASNYARTLNTVIRSVLMNCPFYDQLTIHDRDFALIWLWSNNYAPTRTVSIKCSNPECGAVENVTVDMTKLEINEPVEGFTGSVTFTLKATNKPITVRLRTVADELAAEEYMLSNKNARFDHLTVVSSIDLGMYVPLDKKLEWVNTNITGKEMALIKKFHEHYAYGVKTRLSHKCRSCGEVTFFDLPFSPEDILSPKLSDDFEELLRSMQDS